MNVSKKVWAGLPLVLALLVQGCANGDKAAYSMKEEETGTLKVMFHSDSYFYQQYGNLFNAKFPNIELQVVNMQDLYKEGVTDYKKALEDLIEKENPDVLMLNLDQYTKYAEENKLLDLEPMLQEEDFKSADIWPGSLKLLREKGGGKLFGLSPDFYSQGLYYNKDLFDKYGVPVPTKSLSWQEVIELAKRFPTDGSKEDRVYGLAMNYGSSIFQLGSAIGGTTGLQFIDGQGSKVTIQSDGWKKAFGLAVDALKSGALYVPGQQDPSSQSYVSYMSNDVFFTGKAAMTLNGSYYVNQLQDGATYDQSFKPFKWGVLTEPVDPANPDLGTSLSLSEIFAINAKSTNTKAAWQLVKSINSDQVAKLNSRTSNSGGLMSRVAYNKAKDGTSLDAFYSLQPREQLMDWANVPNTFFEQFNQLAEVELQSVSSDNKTIDEALAVMQSSGQATLEKARKDEEEAKAKKQ
ncbi:ABC transporter substrate-binding protein [Paenibacillus kobensis]|uniref:ABC transporter substrate-binding protein n=1 Tax=Paenibacillus kobensis TaxID=59841 RepID=UPI000FD881B7|nr:extracellular solute-binding protein [Paenibacillus kobensis]